MTADVTAGAGARLRGRRVFLSASIPDARRSARFRRLPDAHLYVTEAVLALTRAVLSHGGRLVMGAHPTISPLVAQVAGEYRLPAAVEGERRRPGAAGGGGPDAPRAAERDAGEPQIIVYQSRVFEACVPAETLMLERLGYARIAWTDVVGNETFDRRRGGRKRPAPKSLLHMRDRMLRETEPVAMVCAGGMEGVIDEARAFARLWPRRTIYTMATTGGAASLLRGEEGLHDVVREIDAEILEDLERLWREHPVAEGRAPGEGRPGEDEAGRGAGPRHPHRPSNSVVYPLAMQTIVDELGGGETGRGEEDLPDRPGGGDDPRRAERTRRRRGG